MAKKKASAFPVSKARTAFGLLSEIAKLGLEEPRRIRMEDWGGWRGNAQHLHPDARPACGTYGCIGGWTEALMRERRVHAGRATEILGLTSEQAARLFYPFALLNAQDQGTLAHAKAVARHIAAFQRRHARKLKATRLG